jgi:hypothetical protein
MDRACIHAGLSRMRFSAVLDRTERSELSQMEASELVCMRERTIRGCLDARLVSGEPVPMMMRHRPPGSLPLRR